MAENPLLPDAELRNLHRLVEAAAKAQAAARRPRRGAPAAGRSAQSAGHEAFLAATLLQLRKGDLVVSGLEGAAARTLLDAAASITGSAAAAIDFPETSHAFSVAAAAAASLKALGQGGLVLALVETGIADASWPAALAWVQQQQLPLILACADPSGPDRFQRPGARQHSGVLHWTTFAKTARRLGLPVLCVDGEDAVAVYRVMQESVLRARVGGGPAALWAMLPRSRKLPPGTRSALSAPLLRIRRYLRTRKISL